MLEDCAHENQEKHRYCNQCGARLETNARTRRESFRESTISKPAPDGDAK